MKELQKMSVEETLGCGTMTVARTFTIAAVAFFCIATAKTPVTFESP
jgi:hypothetical protein